MSNGVASSSPQDCLNKVETNITAADAASANAGAMLSPTAGDTPLDAFFTRWCGRGIQHHGHLESAVNRVSCIRMVVAVNLRHANPQITIYDRSALVDPWILDEHAAAQLV